MDTNGFHEISLNSLREHYSRCADPAGMTRFAQRVQKRIRPGFRVEFLGSPDESITALPHTWGTVLNVDDAGMIFVGNAATGYELGLDFGDSFRIFRPVGLVRLDPAEIEKVVF